MIVRERVLVLNQDYQAIGICSVERAFVLVMLKKAEMLSANASRRLKTIAEDF